MAMCAGTVHAGTLVASTVLEGSNPDATDDEAAATHTRAVDSRRPDQPCFPVSVPVWAVGFHGEDYVTGWASVDQTAHFAGPSCQVKGWAPIDLCGRTISAYLANCRDGTFTFTKTEADCYYVLGCRDPQKAAAYWAPR